MTDTSIVDVAVRALGWAILHSVWQGAVISALTALVLRAFRGSSANVRYVAACLGLAALALSWAITAVGYASEIKARVSVRQVSEEASRALPASPELRAPETLPASPARPALPALEAWQARLEAWSVAIVPLWLVGVVALSVRLICGWFLVERIRRAATGPVPEMWLAHVHNMAKHLDIGRTIRIAQSAVVHVPTVIGWLRPVILLPASVFTGLSPAQLEAVIAHELAHVRRHDYAVNILQTAIEVLLFYHPASWWISRQVRVEREHCCDDIAVAVCGNRYVYAEALADLETLRSDTPALGLAVTDGPLMRRVRRLIAPSSTSEGFSPAWATAAVPLTVLTLVLMSTNVTSMQVPGTAAPQTQTPSAAQIVPSNEGVVQGRVVDARSGQPVAHATVQLLGPERESTALTGADGRFEVRGLAPAEYRLEAQAPGYAPIQYGQREMSDRPSTLDVQGGRYTTGVDFRLYSVGAVSGRIFDSRGEGLAGVEMELVTERYLPGGSRPLPTAFAQTEAFGVFRFAEVLPGEYYVRAYAPESLKPVLADAAEAIRKSLEQLARDTSAGDAYGSTYYPGVTSVDQAQSLRVNAGQELFDINFTLATVKTHRIAGIVIDPTGDPVSRTQVVIHSIGPSGSSEHSANVGADGRFEISGVVPGDYMVMVRGLDRTQTFNRWFSAGRQLTIDHDVVALELKASLGARVEGRIVRDSGVTRPLDPTKVRMEFQKRVQAGSSVALSNFSPFRVEANGTFTGESPGGPLSFHVVDLPANWVVKSVRLDGVEIGNEAIDFGAGARRRIEVVLTDRSGTVTGSVHDRNGRPVTNYSVVIFPNDATLWPGESRFVRETRTGQGGQFRIEGLPSADYLAVAVESLPFSAWTDPQVLERLRPSATRFHLGEGEQATLSLRASPAPDLVGPSLKPVNWLLVARDFIARLSSSYAYPQRPRRP